MRVQAIQQLFGPLVEAAAASSGVIQRKRTLTASSLARTFVLGFLRKPRATDEDLAPDRGALPDARDAAGHRAAAHAAAGGVSRNALPRSRSGCGRFGPGSGGDSRTLSRGDRARQFDHHIAGRPGENLSRVRRPLRQRPGGVEAANRTRLAQRRHDPRRNGAGPQHRQRDMSGSMHGAVRDRCGSPISATSVWAVFAAMTRAGEYFLSRLQFGTHVFLADGEHSSNCCRGSPHTTGRSSIARIVLGKSERLACRLIAWRVAAGTGRPPASEAAREPPIAKGATHRVPTDWRGATGRSW